MKRCLTSLANANQNYVEIPFTLFRMALIKKKTTSNVGKDVEEKKESLYTACGNVNLNSHYRSQYGGF